jgi:hypothetical protein
MVDVSLGQSRVRNTLASEHSVSPEGSNAVKKKVMWVSCDW